MDHLWWAPHMHKKMSGPKIESQLRNTFGQSLIVTLYACCLQILSISDNPVIREFFFALNIHLQVSLLRYLFL